MRPATRFYGTSEREMQRTECAASTTYVSYHKLQTDMQIVQ